MATGTPQHGEGGSETSRSMGTSSNATLVGTEQQCRHQLVHLNAANAASENITLDAHLKIIRKTRNSKN